jgi:hypothetical protein
MLRNRFIWAIVLGFALLVTGSKAEADSQGTTVQANAAANATLTLSTSLVDFGTLTASDYTVGSKQICPAQTITIDTNKAWVVNLQANSATWTFAATTGTGTEATPSKPASDLQFSSSSTDPKVNAGSTQASFTGLSTSNAQVAKGNKGSKIAVQTCFNLLLNYANDPPGNYSLGITYTLTTP